MYNMKYLIDINNSISEALYGLEQSSPINTLLVTSGTDKKLEGVITDGDVRRRLIEGGNTSDPIKTCINQNFRSVSTNVSKEEILKLFDTGKYKLLPKLDEKGCLYDIITIESLSGEFDKYQHYFVRSIAPVRVSFGGGGSDMTTYFVENGGAVLSSTIRMYARSTLRKRSDLKINICSHDLGQTISFSSLSAVPSDHDDFRLIIAVINTVKPDFGFDLEIRSDFPIGSGLGGSSAICIAILGCFNQYRIEKWDSYQIAEIAFQAERINLGIAGGWQDQYASAFGGFNYIEFNEAQNIVHPLRINEITIRELEHRCILCYTNKNRGSHEIQAKTISNILDSNQDKKVKIQKNTEEIKNHLLRGNIDIFGRLLNENWVLKKEFSPNSSNGDLDSIYDFAMLNGASGGKLLGAGGGGYFLFVSKEDTSFSLQEALEDYGLSVSNIEFEEKGLQAWKFYNYGTDSNLSNIHGGI